MVYPRIVAWSIWMAASLFYAYQYILRVMPNIMMNDITQQFNIDATAFGQFSGIYYLGYSLMHLPIGIMLDRSLRAMESRRRGRVVPGSLRAGCFSAGKI